MPTRRSFLATAAALPLAALALPALAEEPAIHARDGAAIGGYDPVAYFTEGAPVEGSPEHSTMWNGAEWRFASAENKATFEADPEAYAPQYGGYCAYAASQGYVASTSPDAWSVHEGKLYLNYSRRVQRIWEKDKPGFIAQADTNWPAPLSK
ncbi:MAG: YHS domain-containing (seleno)protein [Roseovarius sp.]